MWARATKLCLDFAPQSRRADTMEDDTHELIAQLFTRAGMIMEDASVIALTVAGMHETERKIAVAELGSATKQISALIAAAEALGL